MNCNENLYIRHYKKFPEREASLFTENVSHYIIFHLKAGMGILNIGFQIYFLDPGDIVFLQPGQKISWQLSTEGEGYLCLVHPQYFGVDYSHVLQLFLDYPFLNRDDLVVSLHAEQLAAVTRYFERLANEDISVRRYKKQAILVCLQLILLEVKRALCRIEASDVADRGRKYPIPNSLEYFFRKKRTDT